MREGLPSIAQHYTVEELLQQMPILVGIQPEFVHQSRQVGPQRFRRAAYPGQNHRLHADALLALVIRNSLGDATQLRFGRLAHRIRGLPQHLVEQIFGGMRMGKKSDLEKELRNHERKND